MSRQRQTREDVRAEEAVKPKGSEADRRRAEAIKRGRQRLSRGGDIGNFNKKLEVDLPLLKEIHPGYRFRWVKDQSGRLTTMYNRGYDFVPYDSRLGIGEESTDGNTDVGGRVSVIAGADASSKEGGYRQFLMMIPEEIYSEIQKLKQEKNDEVDRAIHSTLDGGGKNPVANAYKPDDGGGYYKP